MKLPRRSSHSRRHGFTLAELLMAMAIGLVVCGTTMTGVIFLQKSYAATEQYALSMADQMRVLDYLSMDLRRASGVTIDNINKTLTLALPPYYTYSTTDAKHQNPVPVLPSVTSDATRATYTAGAGTTTPVVTYRFDRGTNQLQRKESFTDSTSGTWQTVASQVNDFPLITPDASNPQKYTIAVSFTPAFQTLDTPDSNVITLTGTVFLRND